MKPMKTSRDISRAVEIIAALRAPGTGCPWDLEQNFTSIASYTIEEAYEVAHAITLGDLEDLQEELGDLLFHVIFHSRLAEEGGYFNFGDVVETLTAKLIRRHPHVFGETQNLTSEAAEALRHEIKTKEKEQRVKRRGTHLRDSECAFEDIPIALPAFTRALKLQQQALKLGLISSQPKTNIATIRGQIDQIEAALDGTQEIDLASEVGDLLFAVVQLVGRLDNDPESALRVTNQKFERGFAKMARTAAAGQPSEGTRVIGFDRLRDGTGRTENS
jgi:ATP diphosphatase